MSGTETTASTADVSCTMCGGSNVEVSLPAWFDPNDGWSYIEYDEGADAFTTWCRDCANHCVLKTREGSYISGRW